jgi:deoxyribodipyrimidine photo-lyase
MAQDERIKFLNRAPRPPRRGIAYWMQASVRSGYNHALEYAIHLANHREEELLVFFALTPDYPGANLRHYWFLIQGLQDVARSLGERGIPFHVFSGDPPSVATAVAGATGTIVTDRGYTRIQREWRRAVAESADCPVVQVESNVVVPLETASTKDEWAAATLRPKIHRNLETFLKPLSPQVYRQTGHPTTISLPSGTGRLDLDGIRSASDLRAIVSLDASVEPVGEFVGGGAEARRRLHLFLQERLPGYGEHRNVPDEGWASELSPYLHFGHISPVEIALAARDALDATHGEKYRGDLDTLLEELIVRRELAMHFAEFNEAYDRYEGLPDWARKTLEEHAPDERPAIYTPRQLENAETADPYWNACQREMVRRGKMHGYMRMYWGKKILEWRQDPADAMQIAISLNDTYELDGRDPNGYAGVAWCFGKHDRGWPERPVFGKVRYMNAAGLKRKFKGIDRYLDRWRE